MNKLKFRSDEIYFTSDLHFFHKNIISFSNRPYNDIEEMNEGIIKNWNNKVKNNSDTVFILGDVTWFGNQVTKPLIDQLKGNKILIIGNHDNKICNLFEKTYDMLGIDVIDDVTGNIQYCHLCHYPLLDWDKKYHGSWNLHGHCHLNKELKHCNQNQLDVGLDGNDMQIYSYNEIFNILK